MKTPFQTVFSRAEFALGPGIPHQLAHSGHFVRIRGFANLENTLVSIQTQPLIFNVENNTNLCLLPILRVYSNKD